MTRLRIVTRPQPLGRCELEPGDMWRDPDMDVDGVEAWAIVLPNHAGMFYTTQSAELGPGLGRFRWTVTGTPPEITVEPSINAEPAWHGRITAGSWCHE